MLVIGDIMKDFSTWQADMSNKYEDKSYFIKPCPCGAPAKKSKTTELQTRMAIADVLVPEVLTKSAVTDWVSAFCVTLRRYRSGPMNCSELALHELVGIEETKLYTKTDCDADALIWWWNFRDQIEKGLERV